MIGRDAEIAKLTEECEKESSRLIAIYGRRRIGKTYLVNTMFTEHRKECAFFRFTGSYMLDASSQIEYFVIAVEEWFGIKPDRIIKTWAYAFTFLKQAIISIQKQHKRIVLFLDEVPWIDQENKSGFLGAFGYFWNEFALNDNHIVCILCGSNSAWIKHKIFEDSKGPLYQRLDCKIHLKPFTLKETKQFLLEEKGFMIDDKTVVEAYMIFGGVAKYLEFLDPKKSIAQNVDDLIFNVDGHLNKEYTEIFLSLFSDKSSYYAQIIDVLIQKQSGLTQTEITNTLKESNSIKLKKAIDELCETGFLQVLNRFGSKINVRLKICDPFILFYNTWVKPFSKNEILALQKPYFTNVMSSQKYAIWAGFAFETLCLSNIDAYLQARSTKGLAKSYHYWSTTAKEEGERGAQIDLLVEYQNNVYDVVECKFYNTQFEITKKYKEDILNKIEQLKKYLSPSKFDIKLVFLTSYGCERNQYYNSLNIADDITIEQLM